MFQFTLPPARTFRWLDIAHRKLDEAVFAAYGWNEAPGALSDQDLLARLLALNLERSGRSLTPSPSPTAEGEGSLEARGPSDSSEF